METTNKALPLISKALEVLNNLDYENKFEDQIKFVQGLLKETIETLV